MELKRCDEVAEWDKTLEEYLFTRVESGDRFFKSRHIATDLDVSPKKVGASIYRLTDSSSELEIDTWGGTSDGTTWYIVPHNSNSDQ